MKRKNAQSKQKAKPAAKKDGGFVPVTRIKVVGVGGGGGNAVSRMSRSFGRGVDFIAVNTDHQDLDNCDVRRKVYIGRNLTRGMGTGMNPELGRQAAEENRSEIAEAIAGADLVFIAAGLGGGTGTGAGPIVAEVAKQAGALTLAFVTKPFGFEGSQRERIAQEGLLKLKDKVDALVVVANDRIFSVVENHTPIVKAFEAIDDILKNALQGIVELIASPGMINVDFADVKAIVSDAGSAIVGMGIASGSERATQAVQLAMNSPLLEITPEGAKGVILGISGRDLTMAEVNEAARLVSQTADPAAKIIFGAYHDRRLGAKQLKVTLVATSFNGMHQPNSLFARDLMGRGRALRADAAGSISEMVPSSLAAERRGADIEVDDFSPGKEKKSTEDAGSKKETGSDIWDIPTFLRRRKR